VPAGQSLVYEELDDGVMLFDVLVGGTHLINATAAELLLLIEQSPGLTTEQLHARLAARLEVTAEQLPLGAVDDILQWLARLNIVAAHGP
jgi:PqqD family protein of HPr-rel-A system